MINDIYDSTEYEPPDHSDTQSLNETSFEQVLCWLNDNKDEQIAPGERSIFDRRDELYNTFRTYLSDELNEVTGKGLNHWISREHDSIAYKDNTKMQTAGGLFISAAINEIDDDPVYLPSVRQFRCVGYRNTGTVIVHGDIGPNAAFKQEDGSFIVRDAIDGFDDSMATDVPLAGYGFASQIQGGEAGVQDGGIAQGNVASNATGGYVKVDQAYGAIGHENNGAVIDVGHYTTAQTLQEQDQAWTAVGPGMDDGLIRIWDIEEGLPITVGPALSNGTIGIDAPVQLIGTEDKPVRDGRVVVLDDVGHIHATIDADIGVTGRIDGPAYDIEHTPISSLDELQP